MDTRLLSMTLLFIFFFYMYLVAVYSRKPRVHRVPVSTFQPPSSAVKLTFKKK